MEQGTGDGGRESYSSRLISFLFHCKISIIICHIAHQARWVEETISRSCSEIGENNLCLVYYY